LKRRNAETRNLEADQGERRIIAFITFGFLTFVPVPHMFKQDFSPSLDGRAFFPFPFSYFAAAAAA
jgi:hypothetical protein